MKNWFSIHSYKILRSAVGIFIFIALNILQYIQNYINESINKTNLFIYL